jgi:hypothetical protein
MSGSALYVVVGCVAAAQFFSPDSFNQFSDYLSPVYALLILAIIRYYRNLPLPKRNDRVYELAKKDIPWQQKFVGTWDKIERPGFKEVSYLFCNLLKFHY